MASSGSSILVVLAGACLVGAVAGLGSVATTSAGRAALTTATRPIGVAGGLARRRPPRPGDYWDGCNAARAAGTEPIYRGEPGYREDMDGDGDGEACEPLRN